MTSALFDTHAFVWAAGEETRLSAEARKIFVERRVEVWVSVASVWEIAIKRSIGKMRAEVTLEEMLRRATVEQGVRLLPIEPTHVLRVESLPHHHRDPFDRLLVAQSLLTGWPLVSSDATLDAYGIERIW